jgi:hypothetical protein
MNFDISNWDKRNVDVLPSGELCVREEFRRISSTFTGLQVLAGWTIKCQTTDVVWHYIVTLSSSLGVQLYIVDENQVTIQLFTYNSFTPPKDVSLSVIEDQVMICSPDLPALWGIVGSGVVIATSQASVNTMTTALTDIPMGIAVSWAGRNVIATREAMYFSDALYPRTYVGQNAIDPPGGSIYGLHVNAGGALIVCTTTGVYALPEDAAASGQIVIGIFSKLTDYECINYRTTASCKGRVYGLTKRGYRVVDDKGSDEVMLDDSTVSMPSLSGFSTGRIHFNDYREGKIFGGHDGVYVWMAGRAISYSNFSAKMKSWWTTTVSTMITSFGGMGFENDGTELFFFVGPHLRCGNNGNEADPIALVSGRVELPPELSPVVRYVTFASDTYESFRFFIRDTLKTATPKQFSPIVGTDTWEGGTKYIEPRIQSRQTDWALRGDDLVFVLGVSQHPSKIPSTLDVEFKGPGKKRHTN